mmetsp:Transcript_20361/g.28342  ORF Transcript_20361/g.28342 Transcript_20361/m.28342 type:complete len:512 (-) Transcript_20361:338-1873(-)
MSQCDVDMKQEESERKEHVDKIEDKYGSSQKMERSLSKDKVRDRKRKERASGERERKHDKRRESRKERGSREREHNNDKERRRKDRSRNRNSEGRSQKDVDQERRKIRERGNDKEHRRKDQEQYREKRDRHKDRRKRDRSSKPIVRKPKKVAVDEDMSREEMQSLLERLYDPSTVRNVESKILTKTGLLDSNSLTKIPWELCTSLDRCKNDVDSQTNGNNGMENIYPTWSYLDLRLMQNKNWATRRLQDGTKLAKEFKWRQAENCYKEALDLVPTHAEVWVAYGCLCANTGRLQEGINKLEQALKEDPDCPNAQKYLDSILKTNAVVTNNGPKKPPLATKSEKALQDVIAEKAFLGESQDTKTCSKRAADADDAEKYPMIPSDQEDEGHSSYDPASDSCRKRKKRHRKHSRRHRKRRSNRRKHGRSHHSESPSQSADDSSFRRHRHRQGHLNRRSRSNSASDDSVRSKSRPHHRTREHHRSKRRQHQIRSPSLSRSEASTSLSEKIRPNPK